MTDLHVDIGDVVLRGTPASYAASFGTLVEARIGVLARGGDLSPGPGGDAETSLADLVARQVWDEVRRATDGLRGEQS
jgi:hypothetical protein